MIAGNIKAVFFDLDGTLVDIHGPLYNAARKALDELGHQPPLTREAYYRAMSQDDRWLGIPEHLRRDFTKLAWAYFIAEADLTERFEVLPHVKETLVELKRHEFVTGVITSRPGDPRILMEKLAMVGLASYLDEIVTQTTRSMSALDKSESLLRTAARAGVLTADCMYVGDEPRDIMAASNAGYRVKVAVSTGAASFEHLAKHEEFKPDFVLRSMSELLGLIEKLGKGETR